MIPLFHEQAYRFARPELEGMSLGYGVTAVNYANLRSRIRYVHETASEPLSTLT